MSDHAEAREPGSLRSGNFDPYGHEARALDRLIAALDAH
jgi:hypothetical protein